MPLSAILITFALLSLFGLICGIGMLRAKSYGLFAQQARQRLGTAEMKIAHSFPTLFYNYRQREIRISCAGGRLSREKRVSYFECRSGLEERFKMCVWHRGRSGDSAKLIRHAIFRKSLPYSLQTDREFDEIFATGCTDKEITRRLLSRRVAVALIAAQRLMPQVLLVNGRLRVEVSGPLATSTDFDALTRFGETIVDCLELLQTPRRAPSRRPAQGNTQAAAAGVAYLPARCLPK